MVLIDTHVVLWLAQSPGMLSANATEAVAEAREQGGVAIADKTLWELAMMITKGAVSPRLGTARDFLEAVEKHFVVFPITAAIADRSQVFTRNFPRDPTDRLIASSALVHGLRLVTADTAIRTSGEVPCIW